MSPHQLRMIALADLLFWHSALFKSVRRADLADERDLEDLAVMLEKPELAENWIELSRRIEETLPLTSEFESARLFDGNVICPVNETGYVRREKGNVIGDISGFYRAFGFTPTLCGEKLDHISIELDFMGLLLMMATFDDVSDEKRAIAYDAAKEFANSHLGEWLPSFAARLKGATVLPLFEASAKSLLTLWGAVASELHISSTSDIQEPKGEDPIPHGICETDTRVSNHS